MPPIVDLDTTLALLPKFVKAHGHGRVPANCVVDGFPLGDAVAELRYAYNRRRLSAADRAQLDRAGMCWSITAADRWADGIADLTAFVAEHGHANVPANYETPYGFKLGPWLTRTRRKWRAGQLPDLHVQILADLGADSASKRDDFAGNVHAVTVFVTQHGHTQIPADYVTADGRPLGRWLAQQQDLYESGQMMTWRVRALRDAGLPWQTTFDADWDRGFAALSDWVAEHGHPDPGRDAVVDGYAVGAWWRRQYLAWQAGKLRADRVRRLELLGASPVPENSSTARWRQSMRRLQDFIRDTGHAQVPKQYHSPDGYALGRWLRKQRHRYRAGLLSADRIADLEDVGVCLSRPVRTGRPRTRVAAQSGRSAARRSAAA